MPDPIESQRRPIERSEPNIRPVVVGQLCARNGHSLSAANTTFRERSTSAFRPAATDRPRPIADVGLLAPSRSTQSVMPRRAEAAMRDCCLASLVQLTRHAAKLLIMDSRALIIASILTSQV